MTRSRATSRGAPMHHSAPAAFSSLYVFLLVPHPLHLQTHRQHSCETCFCRVALLSAIFLEVHHGHVITISTRAVVLEHSSYRAFLCFCTEGWFSGRQRCLAGTCESVLFIGTRFSNLYTAVDTPARAAWLARSDLT